MVEIPEGEAWQELNLEPLVVFANDGPPPNVPTLSEEGYRMLPLGLKSDSCWWFETFGLFFHIFPHIL